MKKKFLAAALSVAVIVCTIFSSFVMNVSAEEDEIGYYNGKSGFVLRDDAVARGLFTESYQSEGADDTPPYGDFYFYVAARDASEWCYIEHEYQLQYVDFWITTAPSYGKANPFRVEKMLLQGTNGDSYICAKVWCIDPDFRGYVKVNAKFYDQYWYETEMASYWDHELKIIDVEEYVRESRYSYYWIDWYDDWMADVATRTASYDTRLAVEPATTTTTTVLADSTTTAEATTTATDVVEQITTTTEPETTTTTAEEIYPDPTITGDLNGDDLLNMSDVMLLYQFASGACSLTDAQLAVADIDGDGIANIRDAFILYLIVAGH